MDIKIRLALHKEQIRHDLELMEILQIDIQSISYNEMKEITQTALKEYKLDFKCNETHI